MVVKLTKLEWRTPAKSTSHRINPSRRNKKTKKRIKRFQENIERVYKMAK